MKGLLIACTTVAHAMRGLLIDMSNISHTMKGLLIVWATVVHAMKGLLMPWVKVVHAMKGLLVVHVHEHYGGPARLPPARRHSGICWWWNTICLFGCKLQHNMWTLSIGQWSRDVANYPLRTVTMTDDDKRSMHCNGGEVLSAVQCSAVQCSAVQCSAVQCSAIVEKSLVGLWSWIQLNPNHFALNGRMLPALHCTALHCTALHCTTLNCTASSQK
jgi:hypothetical protein